MTPSTPNPFPIPNPFLDASGNVTAPYVNWANQLQTQIAAAGGAQVFAYQLGAGANALDVATLGLPDAGSAGEIIAILLQPGDGTITWSTEFSGTVVGIDQDAGTFSVFRFAAYAGQWVMTAYPTTGMSP